MKRDGVTQKEETRSQVNVVKRIGVRRTRGHPPTTAQAMLVNVGQAYGARTSIGYQD